jgi:hypothetical protein
VLLAEELFKAVGIRDWGGTAPIGYWLKHLRLVTRRHWQVLNTLSANAVFLFLKSNAVVVPR